MEKPNRYILTENWGPKILIVWFSVFLLINLIVYGFPLGLQFPIMGILISVASMYGVQFVLKFQKVNSNHMKRKVYDFAVLFFWSFSTFGTLLFIMWALSSYGTNDFISFLTISIFPIGISIGASKQWTFRENFQE